MAGPLEPIWLWLVVASRQSCQSSMRDPCSLLASSSDTTAKMTAWQWCAVRSSKVDLIEDTTQ